MSVCNSNGETENDENGEEELDPRIQNELERLNKSCSDINTLENDLDAAKSRFIFSKNKQLERIQYWQKKNGNNITKCKPYYEALRICEALQLETQNAVHDFQKANSLYKTAKETLAVAECSLRDEFHGEIPDEWQEHLSLTITKIGLSKEAADRAGSRHQAVAEQCQQAEKRAQGLDKELKKYIDKSKLFYDEKLQWNVQIKTQKSQIHYIEQTLIYTKKVYKEAMQNLSLISEEIHNKRKLDKILKAEASKQPQFLQTTPDSDSISIESRSSETDSKKVSNFLNLYNLSLPQKNLAQDTNTLANSEATTKTYDQLKDCEALEYVSLGLNSTPSNSRSSSPSNSIDAEISDWISGKPNGNQTKQTTTSSEISSNSTNLSFSNSSVPRLDAMKKIQPFNEQQFLTPVNNLGISSLTLKSPAPVIKKQVIEPKMTTGINLTPTFKTNGGVKSSNRISKSKNSTKNETPLLSNLLLQHSARF